MTIAKQPGQIITFYSYKGGTGRSMAVANIGCLLARLPSKKAPKVLLVDWDLEAPGLHRFFLDRSKESRRRARSKPTKLDLHPGLVDIFTRLNSLIQGTKNAVEEPSEDTDTLLKENIPLKKFVLRTHVRGLHLLKAGRFDEKYAETVNTFPWAALYARAPWLFPWFGNLLAKHYQYVLIDSRTGITDASGICTTILPEKLVTVFTPNRQSVEGVVDIARRAVTYRRRSDDLRPLVIFPLASRIEPTMERLRHLWRFNSELGYQPLFEDLIKSLYGLSKCDLTDYFNEIQIQQVPDYAYGEEIAVLVEPRSGDRLSLARSYRSFLGRMLSSAAPWEESHEQQSVFISYSSKDQEIASRLQTDLEKNGFRTWFAPRDLRGGKVFKPEIEKAIREYNRILVVLSENSIGNPWVRREIEQSFDREKNENRIVLFPLTIDDAIDRSQSPSIADIRRIRRIADFRGWRQKSKYQRALARLVRDLKAAESVQKGFEFFV